MHNAENLKSHFKTLEARGGAVGLGGDDDGITVGCGHLLTDSVEDADVGNLLVVHNPVNARTLTDEGHLRI